MFTDSQDDLVLLKAKLLLNHPAYHMGRKGAGMCPSGETPESMMFELNWLIPPGWMKRE